MCTYDHVNYPIDFHGADWWDGYTSTYGSSDSIYEAVEDLNSFLAGKSTISYSSAGTESPEVIPYEEITASKKIIATVQQTLIEHRTRCMENHRCGRSIAHWLAPNYGICSVHYYRWLRAMRERYPDSTDLPNPADDIRVEIHFDD